MLNLGFRQCGWSMPFPGCFTPGKEARYPLYRVLGGPQGWSGSWHHRLQTPNCPVYIKSPYQPCYLGSYIKVLNSHPMIYVCSHWGGDRGITICKLALKGNGLSVPCCICRTTGKTWYVFYIYLDCPWSRSGWQRNSLPHRDSIVGLSSPQWFPIMTVFPTYWATVAV
jgi:hypothetical protein